MKLKYTIVKSQDQYNEYCRLLQDLVIKDDREFQDEIDLLTLLIEKWDKDHSTFNDLDPIELLKSLMRDHCLKPKDLVVILGLSKGTVSKILNYHKGLSKNSIRKLSHHFAVSQEAFNRPYRMINDDKRNIQDADLMNTA